MIRRSAIYRGFIQGALPGPPPPTLLLLLWFLLRAPCNPLLIIIHQRRFRAGIHYRVLDVLRLRYDARRAQLGQITISDWNDFFFFLLGEFLIFLLITIVVMIHKAMIKKKIVLYA